MKKAAKWFRHRFVSAWGPAPALTLPDWFKIETPLGTYNPDWAILKEDDTVLYLVRETKGTKDFEKLRNIEAEKIRCGRKHFETLKVDFDVVTSVSEI